MRASSITKYPTSGITALVLAALLLAAPFAVAEGSDTARETVAPQKLKEQAQQLEEKLAEYDQDQRDEAMSHIRETLDALDSRIEKLDQTMTSRREDMDRRIRAQAKTSLAHLNRERLRAAEWYQRMEDSASFTWESMKDGFDDAYSKLVEAWLDAEEVVSASEATAEE
ncbi:hypothetical protein [Marinobacter sp.]|uniref:hypothetical protein n=1 Tax=Marinobacter sp. TaxID=50741 RepID=UPI00384FC7B4